MTDLEKIFNGKFLFSEESIKPLRFFIKKYQGRQLHSDTLRIKMGGDILRVAHYIFNHPELLAAIDLYRQAKIAVAERTLPKRVGMESSMCFVELIDELQAFYDLNMEHPGEFLDKRVHVFTRLKSKLLKGLRFLERRVTPLTVKGKIGSPQQALLKQKKGKAPTVSQRGTVFPSYKERLREVSQKTLRKEEE